MSEIPEPIMVWPTEHWNATSTGFDLISQSLSSVSTIGADVHAEGPVDQRFVCQITFPPREHLQGRAQAGLMARLRGIRQRVRLGDISRRIPAYNMRILEQAVLAGVAFGDGTRWTDQTGWLDGFLPPYVAVAQNAQRGSRSVLMSGFPASLSSVLSMGDLWECRPNGQYASHAHLYQVTHVANSDADGMTRVEFEPGLRLGIAAGDQIVLRDPKTVFRLLDEQQGRSTIDGNGHWRMGATLVEVPLPLPVVEFGQ